MIERLTLTRFKRFDGRVEVPLAPITLLLGPNSSGKSSVMQALLARRQSAQSGFDGFDGFVTRGSDVNLGRFGNVVHGELDEAERALREKGAKDGHIKTLRTPPGK